MSLCPKYSLVLEYFSAAVKRQLHVEACTDPKNISKGSLTYRDFLLLLQVRLLC